MTEYYGMSEHSQMGRTGNTVLMAFMDNRGDTPGTAGTEELCYARWSYDAGLTWSAEEMPLAVNEYGAPHTFCTPTYGVIQDSDTFLTVGQTTRRAITGWTNSVGVVSTRSADTYERFPRPKLRGRVPA